MSIGNVPESLSHRILVGIFLVGGLGICAPGYIYIYIYIYVHTYNINTYLSLSLYIYRERERQRDI